MVWAELLHPLSTKPKADSIIFVRLTELLSRHLPFRLEEKKFWF
jgi:hypothetical protein